MILKSLVDILFFLISLLFFSFYSSGSPMRSPGTSPLVFVELQGDRFQLVKNGKPFTIKGASGNSHLKELAEYGGNTLRVYDTTNLKQVLDEANRHDLSVIVDIPIPAYSEKHNLYDDTRYTEALKHGVRQLVRRYKGHEALLMWNLGNEVNYPLLILPNNFIRTYNQLIDLVHLEDPDHPVGTTIPSISKKQILSISIHSPKLDLLGYNIFGNIKNLESDLFKISFFPRYFPYYISEWGHDGPWEAVRNKWGATVEPTSTKKIEQINRRYYNILQPLEEEGMGSLSFFWGSKLEGTHTWFSLFPEQGLKSELLRSIESFWKDKRDSAKTIGLEYMLVDGQGAYSSKVFKPSQQKTALLKFLKPQEASTEIRWEIYPDIWYSQAWHIDSLPTPVRNDSDRAEGNKFIFRTPDQSGPYRLFAYVIDNEGYFASTNTPFYVISDGETR